jgi:hypothetical protein
LNVERQMANVVAFVLDPHYGQLVDVLRAGANVQVRGPDRQPAAVDGGLLNANSMLRPSLGPVTLLFIKTKELSP